MKKFKEILNSKPVIGVLIFIVLSLGSVLAGNVIVKEGSMEIGNNFNSSGVLFVNQSSGRVGIGTASPTYQLDVNGSVLGISTSFGGFGVQGWANGNQSNAIYGYNLGISGRAVYGQAAGTNGTGVYAYGYGADGYDFYGAKGKNYFAGNVGIKTTSPLYPLVVNSNTSEANQSVSAWFSQNISASGFIDRTSVYDETKGNVWNYIKDSDYYLNPDGTINHRNFYGYSTFGENEEGVDLGKEIAVLRQAVYELKTTLCSLHPELDLCG